ncbi:MAG: AraC family transcriptional regulator [Spirochaetota bacterium]
MAANIKTHYHLAEYAAADFPFRIIDVEEPSLPLHSHDFYEIFLVRSGSAMHMLEHGHHRLTAGDIVLINPFERHGFHLNEGPLLITNIMFSGDLFTNALSPLSTPLAPFYLSARGHTYARAERTAAIAIVNAMQDEFSAARACYRNAIAGLLMQLLAVIERSFSAGRTDRSAVGPMGAVLAHIDAHFTQNITLRMVADICGLNSTYASEQFKRFTGKPFKQYLIGKRVQYAIHLLETTKENVSRICAKAGFNDIANFERTFKRYAGRPPLSFRQ